MRKRFLSTLLAVCVALSLIPMTAFAEGLTKSWADAVTEQPAGYAVDADKRTVTISSAEGLAWFAKQINSWASQEADSRVNFAGYTINITSDIDLSGKLWIPIDTATVKSDGKSDRSETYNNKLLDGAVINGNGYTISGMTVHTSVRGPMAGSENEHGAGQSCYYYSGFIGRNTGSLTIKNLTFRNAAVDAKNEPYLAKQGSSSLAVVVGYNGSDLTFDHVNVMDSTVSGYTKLGGFVGLDGGKISFVQCSVTGCTFNLEGFYIDSDFAFPAFASPVIGMVTAQYPAVNGIKVTGNSCTTPESENTRIITQNGETHYLINYGTSDDPAWYSYYTETVFISSSSTVSIDGTDYSVYGTDYKMAAGIPSNQGYLYPTLASALNNVEEHGTVTLLKDITLTENSTSIEKAITLDLNQKTVNGSQMDNSVFSISDNAVANIKNGTINSDVKGIWCTGGALTLQGVTVNSGTGYAIQMNGAATVTVDQDSVVASKENSGIYLNGQQNQKPVLHVYGTVTGGKDENECCPAVDGTPYDPDDNNKFDPADIYIYPGADVRSLGDIEAIYYSAPGTLTISGGTISGGTNSLYIDSTASDAAISITGGAFSGDITVPAGTSGFISGGTFSARPAASYIAEGCTVVDNPNDTYHYAVGKAVTKVTLASPISLVPGGTQQLTPVFDPADAVNTDVTWASSNERVAAVNTAGLVTAVAPGTATITVTAKDNSYTADCVVKVEVGSAVKIGAVGYDSLTAAVAAVTSGQTITLLRDNTETVTVDRPVSFTLDANGFLFTGAVKAGEGFALSTVNNTYLVAPKNEDSVNVVVQTTVESKVDDTIPQEAKGDVEAAAGNIATGTLTEDLNDTATSKVTDTTSAQAVEQLKEELSAPELAAASVTIVAKTTIEIRATGYEDSETTKSFTVDITPKYQLIATTDPENIQLTGAGKNAVTIEQGKAEISTEIEISIPLPSGLSFTGSDNIFVKHTKDDGTIYNYPGTLNDGRVRFTNPGHGFSTFSISQDNRSATVKFVKDTAEAETVTYTPQMSNDTLPTDSRSGYTFNGWRFDTPDAGDNVYKVMSDTLLTYLNDYRLTSDTELITITAHPDFTRSHTGGGGGGSGSSYAVNVSSVSNGKVTVSPRNASKGTAVTITATPNSGYEVSTVVVTDKNGNKLTVTDRGNGTYTFVMPSGAVDVKVTFQKIEAPAAFDDVAADAWYAEAVAYMCERGLMAGTAQGVFSPDVTLSRGMIAQILYSLEGKPSASGSGFDDVAAGAWYYSAISWAAANGVVSGYGDGRFGPDDNITREQLMTILYAYAKRAGLDLESQGSLSYLDRDSVSGWAYEAACWCTANGIVSGKTGNLLDPNGFATRAEAAQMIQNFCRVLSEQ